MYIFIIEIFHHYFSWWLGTPMVSLHEPGQSSINQTFENTLRSQMYSQIQLVYSKKHIYTSSRLQTYDLFVKKPMNYYK